jgi:hypothetical protein
MALATGPAVRQLQPKLLGRALDIAGGEEALCARLRIDPRALRAWVDGDAALPERIFLAVIDLITDDGIRSAAQVRQVTRGARAA